MNNSFFLMIMFFGVIYFLMIRPQQKQQKKRQQMLNSLDLGDKIVTIGGIHGKIVKLIDTEGAIDIEIAPNVIITIQQSAIGFVKFDEIKGDVEEASVEIEEDK